MATGQHHPLLTGTVVTSVGTLVSRVLGLVRDTATAALFGLAAGGILDALVIAFRIPNLFRALFGEGALTASYLPVFAEALERDRSGAWRLFVATSVWLGRILIVLTLAGQAAIGILLWLSRHDDRAVLLAGLSALLLPYLVLVCLAAVTSATLQALGRFGPPALAPAALNLCWILGAIVIAPAITSDAELQAHILAGCILMGGFIQWAVLWPALRRAGFRFELKHADARDQLQRVRRAMIPTMLALAVTQLNTLADSLLAWVLAAPPDGPQTISWLANIRYPMEQGAAAAIYFGERLYQFPLGLIGIAASTVVFPLLSKHAARKDLDAVSRDLTLGLRLVLLAAVPSAAGLVVLAQPIARLLFEHGQFTASDTLRSARMIAVYGAGVWAYCALPVLVRGFFAVGDRMTPLRVGLAAVVLNLALDLTLIWPLAEVGLAAATAVSAAIQLLVMAVLFSRRHVRLQWRSLGLTALRTSIASLLMAAAGVFVLHQIPAETSTWNALVRVVGPMVACFIAYAATLALIGRSEWRDLFARS